MSPSASTSSQQVPATKPRAPRITWTEPQRTFLRSTLDELRSIPSNDKKARHAFKKEVTARMLKKWDFAHAEHVEEVIFL